MIIDNIEVSLVHLKLVRPYTISYKTTNSVDNLIVKIILRNGLIGHGSSGISEYVVGINTKDSYNNALNKYNEFIGGDIRNFENQLQKVSFVFQDDVGSKAAFDIALYDAFTKYLNISLSSFLGTKINSLPTSITIGIMSIEETIEESKEYFDRGFRYLKVKLGKSLNEDLERIIKLDEYFGNKINIRVDANQGWNKDETIKFFNKTKNIELIEQPLKVDHSNEYLSFPNELKEIIALDESLTNYTDAIKFSSNNYGKIFNIKLMKCGGITEGRKIAQIAALNNINLMWGCNDESKISISAALNTALSFSNTKYLDLDGSFDLAKDLVSGGFTIKDGVMNTVNKPGLGVELI